MRELPRITVGIVKTRERWFNIAVGSVHDQMYTNKIDIIAIDNMEKKFTIGSCFNEIVKRSPNEFILFLGDDDYLVPEYIMSLMMRYFETSERNPELDFVCVTSLTTIFGKDKRKEPSTKTPTGIWTKSYLEKQPFDEYLPRWVDAEMFTRTKGLGGHFFVLCSHQYGYYYRQHENNVSGNKFDSGDYDKLKPKDFQAFDVGELWKLEKKSVS